MTQNEARNFSFNGDNYYLILRTICHYKATEKGFQTRPCSTDREVVTSEHYTNYITSVPFFNNWGDGSYCRAHEHYTEAGYLPAEVVTVGPHRCEKIIARFEFVPLRELRENAGFRELDVLEHADTWTPFECDVREHGHAYTLTTRNGESATFQTRGWRWVG